MSYVIEFPPSRLPKNVSSPPYVLFGINDLDAFSDLPPNIPLALVLHFAPALRKWILPTPELDAETTGLSLRTPYVGINILADMELEGLGWILARMMQVADLKMPPGNYGVFMTHPNLPVSIAIRKAWMALDLPPHGIDALHLHIQTMLMVGSPVTLFEIKGVWHNFPVDSPIQREMGVNFVRNYVDRNYPPSESSAIRHWYLETTERWNFFRKLEKQTPAFGDVQKDGMKAASEQRKRDELYVEQMFKSEREALAALGREKSEKRQARRQERREKRDGNSSSSQRRLERPRSKSLDSVSSVETMIWNPLIADGEEDPTTPTMFNSGPTTPRAQLPDSSAISKMLSIVASDKAVQNKLEEKKSNANMENDLLTAMANDKRIERERIARRLSVGSNDPGDNDGNLEIEFIPPDLSSATKLKLKDNHNTVLQEKKSKSREKSSSAIEFEHRQLVEKALKTAAEVLSPTSQSKNGAQNHTDTSNPTGKASTLSNESSTSSPTVEASASPAAVASKQAEVSPTDIPTQPAKKSEENDFRQQEEEQDIHHGASETADAQAQLSFHPSPPSLTAHLDTRPAAPPPCTRPQV